MLALTILVTEKHALGGLYQSSMSCHRTNPCVTVFSDETSPSCLLAWLGLWCKQRKQNGIKEVLIIIPCIPVHCLYEFIP